MILRPIFFLTAALVLLTCTSNAGADLVVQATNGTQYNITSLQIIYLGNPTPSIEAPISSVITDSIDEVQGKIYVIRSSLPVEKQITSAEQNGAVAVVVISPIYFVPGYLTYRMNDKKLAANISIPVFEVPVVDGKKLWPMVTGKQVLNMTIMPDNIENPWIVVLSSGAIIFNSVFLCLFALVNIGLAVWKMNLFVQFYGGFRSSMALYVLGIEIFSNMVRFAAYIDNQGAFGIYPEWVVQTLMELCIPFAISSYILFTLYWHEMMTNATVVVHPFISKMKIPFFVLSAFLVSLQVIRSIIRNVTTLEFNFNIVTAAVYLAVLVGLIIFYAVTGVKVLKRLHNRKNVGRTGQLNRTTRRILVGGAFLLLFIVMAMLFVIGVPYRPIALPTVWSIFMWIFDSASVMNILAFEVPKSRSSKTRSTSVKPNSATNNTGSETTSTAV